MAVLRRCRFRKSRVEPGVSCCAGRRVDQQGADEAQARDGQDQDQSSRRSTESREKAPDAARRREPARTAGSRPSWRLAATYRPLAGTTATTGPAGRARGRGCRVGVRSGPW